MAKKKIVLSSKEEQEIEKAYIQTAAGRTMFTLTLVACIALLVGLLIETYKVSATNTNFLNPNSLLYTYSNQLFMWGAFAALIGLFFYIKFAVDYKSSKGTTKTVKKTAKTVAKKPQTTKKAEPKAVKKTTKTTAKKTTKKAK